MGESRIESGLTCPLITVHHLPAAQAPGVVSEIMLTSRVNTGGNDDIDPGKEKTLSDRSLEVEEQTDPLESEDAWPICFGLWDDIDVTRSGGW